MKVINAFWEEINTGLKTCEIIFEKGDTFQMLLDYNVEKEFEFSVIKIPVGDLSFVHQIESIGYRYLENQITLLFEVDSVFVKNPLEERLLRGVSCRLVTAKQEIESILSEVSNNMFETDRFSLDMYWAPHLASKRYCNWIRDLYETGTTQFYVIHKDEIDIGFFTMKTESLSYNSCPIAGIYNKHKSAGFIYALTWFWLLKGKEKGLKRLFTSVSSNNRIILSSLSKGFSFKITEINSVFRKIIK